MKNVKFWSILALTCLSIVGFNSCASGDSGGDASSKVYEDKLVVHNLSDVQGLHPTNNSGAAATEVKRYMFQKLLGVDFSSLQLVPWLAASLPTVEVTGDEEGMIINYELKEGAVWDDGRPITPRDVEFSFMCAKNPKVKAPHLRPYAEFLSDFKYDEDNPLKFQFIANKVYFLWDHVTGNDFQIFPEHVYDPNGRMKDLSLKDFADPNGKVAASENNEAFAREYNDVKFNREVVSGSGPYKYVDWQTNQRLIMERKDNWWGEKYKSTNMFFQDGPAEIVYETVNDMTTALTAMKAEKLDAMQAIRPNDWVKLPDSKKFNANYNRSSPPNLYYSYLGLHTKNPKLAGKKTRQAFAHVVDVDKLNESILYNLNKRVIGPVPIMMKNDYNTNIRPYPKDHAKAKQLLKEDGWEDSDGDGILDKIIEGKRQPLSIDFTYNQGNDIRKSVGLAFKEEARQVGIDINVNSLEWSVFSERLKQHKIDMFYGAWSYDARPSDPKQIWHTDSYNSNGSNYVGFGNAETDQLIADIRKELDPAKRAKLYYRFQEILHDECAYLFLFTADRRNAQHKRFTNINEGARDPGFWGGGMQLAKGFSMKDN